MAKNWGGQGDLSINLIAHAVLQRGRDVVRGTCLNDRGGTTNSKARGEVLLLRKRPRDSLKTHFLPGEGEQPEKKNLAFTNRLVLTDNSFSALLEIAQMEGAKVACRPVTETKPQGRGNIEQQKERKKRGRECHPKGW